MPRPAGDTADARPHPPGGVSLADMNSHVEAQGAPEPYRPPFMMWRTSGSLSDRASKSERCMHRARTLPSYAATLNVRCCLRMKSVAPVSVPGPNMNRLRGHAVSRRALAALAQHEYVCCWPECRSLLSSGLNADLLPYHARQAQRRARSKQSAAATSADRNQED